MNYRFYAPENREPGRRYPLYLWLHGLTGRGFDNQSQISFGGNHEIPSWLISEAVQGQEPGFVLAPQCPGGLFWVHFGLPRPAQPLRIAVDLLKEFVSTHPIDPARIYCIGQSMGGFATWALLADYPHLFAAAVPLAGGGRPGKVKAIAKTPVWAFHGDKDHVVRAWRTRQMVKALRQAGGNIRYTEIKDGTHYIWPQAIAEPGLVAWLLAQRNPHPSLTGSEAILSST